MHTLYNDNAIGLKCLIKMFCLFVQEEGNIQILEDNLQNSETALVKQKQYRNGR